MRSDIPIIGENKGIVSEKQYPKPPQYMLDVFIRSEAGKKLLAEEKKPRDILVRFCMTCGAIHSKRSGDMLGDHPQIRMDAYNSSCSACEGAAAMVSPQLFSHLCRVAAFQAQRTLEEYKQTVP